MRNETLLNIKHSKICDPIIDCLFRRNNARIQRASAARFTLCICIIFSIMHHPRIGSPIQITTNWQTISLSLQSFFQHEKIYGNNTQPLHMYGEHALHTAHSNNNNKQIEWRIFIFFIVSYQIRYIFQIWGFLAQEQVCELCLLWVWNGAAVSCNTS